MESPSSPSANDEEGASFQRPQSIVFDDSAPLPAVLHGTTSLTPNLSFDASLMKQKDSSMKSFFMFTFGLLLPFFIVFLIFFLGITLDDASYDRAIQEQQESEEEYPDPYALTLLRNETGGYSTIIDLPDTHELSQCTFHTYGESQNSYYLPSGSISCSASNPTFNDYVGDEMVVWQRALNPSPILNILEAEYSFQSKNLSISFDDTLSENLSLDIFILNQQNQFSKISVPGSTLDGENYTFQVLTNSTDEFYMEMSLSESDYFFSAEACDSCPDEQFPYLDRVQLESTLSDYIRIGNYDPQSNELSFEPLPLVSGYEFPEQLKLYFSIDWIPIPVTNETVWVSSIYQPFQPSQIELSANENGTYEHTFVLADEMDYAPGFDCNVDSSSWPERYKTGLRYPIFCGDVHSSSEYDSMIYQISPFEIDEYLSVLNQSWDPVNREFFVEFNRTLDVQENDFYGSELYEQPFRERPDSIGIRNNFTITFEESDGDRDWATFQMYFEITDNTSIRNGGHYFTWNVCDYCDQNLSEPTYTGISTAIETVGGYNFLNQTLWFHPSLPTPPTVEMSISLAPAESLQRTNQLNYGVYLYGDSYTEYNPNYWYYDYSTPSEDLYSYSFLLSPFVYIGAIIYSFVRGNKAFGKGLISSSIAALTLVGGFIVFVVFFLF